MDLRGKVVLVTGGARMGEALGRELGARGARSAFLWRDSREAAERAVRASEQDAFALQADLASEGAPERVVAEVLSRAGRLDALIHMASVWERRPLEETDADAWDRAFAADARAGFLLARAAAPAMHAAGSGRMIFVSDWTAASDRPRDPGGVAYHAAKSALVGMTRALALELAPRILVNAIAPGPLLPAPDADEEAIRAVERSTPLGRWGGPRELARAALFLLETEFVTGECLRLDGGRHLR